MEILLQILGELLIQLVIEALTELGFHRATVRKPMSPVLAGAGYLGLGALLGGISLLIFPTSFIENETLKLLGLFLIPLLLGLLMLMIGTFRHRWGRLRVGIETFTNGFLFAFGVAFVRFLFTE